MKKEGRCRCGKPMLSTRGGGRYCENCDDLQLRQVLGYVRARTKEDVRYDMYWLNRMNKEFGPLPADVDVQDLEMI